jgi:enediyne biosynthesis protein E4
VSVADYDNDGWPDIYVGNYGKNRLYHNNHDGTFTDVAEKAGVALGNWSPARPGATTTATAARPVCDRLCALRPRQPAHCRQQGGGLRELPVSRRGGELRPARLKGEPDHLFHNNGDGTFTDVTVKAGVEDKDRYYGFTAIFVVSTERQAGPGGGQRLRAELSLHQQRRRNL